MAASKRQDVSMGEVVPGGLGLLTPRIGTGLTDEAFRSAPAVELRKEVEVQKKLPMERRIHAFDREDELAHFIDKGLESVLELTRLLAEVLSCPAGAADERLPQDCGSLVHKPESRSVTNRGSSSIRVLMSLAVKLSPYYLGPKDFRHQIRSKQRWRTYFKQAPQSFTVIWSRH